MKHTRQRLCVALLRRWITLRDATTERDRGQSTAEWVIILAAVAVLIGLVYAAVHAKVLQKIGIINGA
ncbi:hypothetical protein [Streptantibioticus ferralitis]|uniref:Uncharacterized protein n=1 Tax=Streptantibioticus ferralitis TaxID=236510 RepID=A0ABT5Z786_9ACTN|nr:hypothetical protein [Streptantibioticus ferralitis]MDF2259702.1 hypothetical protein [Streptantibioticus ferralitis]